MSPEQAKGRDANRRSDVWAFGAILYEMLSGEHAFKGDDVAETLAAVLRSDIDQFAPSGLDASSVAPAHDPLPRARCLRRLRDIGEARIVLEDLSNGVDPTGHIRADEKRATMALAVRDRAGGHRDRRSGCRSDCPGQPQRSGFFFFFFFASAMGVRFRSVFFFFFFFSFF